jgi:hypothetical protein
VCQGHTRSVWLCWGGGMLYVDLQQALVHLQHQSTPDAFPELLQPCSQYTMQMHLLTVNTGTPWCGHCL